MNRNLLSSATFAAIFVAGACHAHTWTTIPLRDETGALFSHGGGVQRVFDLTFSTVLDRYLMTLNCNNGQLVVAGSPDAQRWSVLASESWPGGQTTGVSRVTGDALLFSTGGTIYRWPFATWTRAAIAFPGDYGRSVGVKGPTVVTADWASGRAFYSTDSGAGFTQGLAMAPIDGLAVTDGSFWATSTTNTSNNLLLESSDGTFFSVVGALPSTAEVCDGLVGMGDRLLMVSHHFAPDNKQRYTIYTKRRNEPFVLHSFTTQVTSSSPWELECHATEQGCLIGLPSLGIVEVIHAGSSVSVTTREDAQFKVNWGGVAIGSGDCAMVTKAGVVAVADLDLTSTNTDLDGDGLANSVETATGTYLSPENTGSNPALPDTDGDGFVDGLEVSRGSNPNLAGSVPATSQASIAMAVAFEFIASSKKSYRIESSVDMNAWVVEEAGIRGNGSTIKRFFPSVGVEKFYRAVEE